MSITSITLTLPAKQPYTATHLARLSAFILHTPRPTLQALFNLEVPRTIASLTLSTPPPDALTLSTCHKLFTLIHYFPHFSASTMPVTLALLLRYRLMPSRPSLAYRDEYILIAAFLLAHKFQDDNDEEFKVFAWKLGLSWKELKGAEMGLVEALEWGVWVKAWEVTWLDGAWREILGLYEQSGRG